MIRINRVLGTALALALVAATAQAQSGFPPPGTPGAPPPPVAAVSLYSPPQLDQMFAAIALYPDPLLSQILAASTYPYEVDAAARWLQAPGNAALADGPLGAVLAGIDWDPSVKSLVPFPQILRMMDAHLDWTQALGNAFLAQQPDVMDSIQRLRHAALAAGALVSSPYQTVTVDGPYIEIEPAQPQSVFVPVYNPVSVYGAWPYPAYPPFYYGPPPGLSARFMVGGIGFSVGIGIVDVLWDWGDWDWRDHDIRVNRDRFNRINAGRPPIAATTWQHDPDHRRGVPYRDAKSRASFEPKVPGSPEQRRQFRFYGSQPQANVPPAQRTQTRPQERPAAPAEQQRTAPQRVAPAPSPQRTQTQPQERPAAPAEQQRTTAPQRVAPAPSPQRTQTQPQERPAAPAERQRTAPQPAPQQVAPAQVPQPQRAQTPQPQRPVPPAPAQVARPVAPTAPAAPSRPATAFQGFTRGPEAQAEAKRGQASRQSAPAAAPRAAPAAAPRAAPAPPPPRAAPPAARPASPQAAPPPQRQPQPGNPQQQEHRP